MCDRHSRGSGNPGITDGFKTLDTRFAPSLELLRTSRGYGDFIEALDKNVIYQVVGMKFLGKLT